MRRSRVLVMSMAIVGLIGTGAAGVSAAPPIDSERFVYSQINCAGGGWIDNAEATQFTRTSFVSTPDNDNDVNVGASVNVAMGLYNPYSNAWQQMRDNTVTLHLGAEARSVNPPTFTNPAGPGISVPTGAGADITVPAGAAGTVLEARVDNWTFTYASQTGSCTTDAGEGIVGLYVNTAPALAADTATTDFESDVTIDVLANDDATWDSGTITSRNPTPAEIASQDDLAAIPAPERVAALAIVATPGHGTVSIAADGTIVYTSTDDFVGDDPFTYAVTDNDGAVSTAEVVVERVLPQVAEVTLRPSASSVAQGGSLTFTATGESAGGYDLGDITSDVVLASDVATDVIDGAQVTFPTAGPHVITATHTPTGAAGSVAVEVVPPAATTPVTTAPGATSSGVGLPSTGGPVLGLLLAGVIGLASGGFVLAWRRRTA